MLYKIKSKIWIEINDCMFLGEGRVKLLHSINKIHSLTKSAKEVKISYKKVWNLINSLNKTSKKPIVMKSTGGNATVITPHEKKLILTFDNINKGCWKYLEKQTLKLNT